MIKVPTGALSTLWVLSIGVGFSILYELITKVVRHRLNDRLINIVDQRLALHLYAVSFHSAGSNAPAGSLARKFAAMNVRSFLSSAVIPVC